MAGVVTFRFADRKGEKSSVAFNTDDITNATLDGIEALIGALTTALQGVTLGNINTRSLKASETVVEAGNPTVAAAQRECKWRLQLADSVTGELLYREIPTADLTNDALFTSGGDSANMSNAAWVSLKSAIDGNFNSPKTGNSLLLLGAEFVGRNL